jgi:hypothetical protein
MNMFVKNPGVPEVVSTKPKTTQSGDSMLVQPSSLAADPTTEGWGPETRIYTHLKRSEEDIVDL